MYSVTEGKMGFRETFSREVEKWREQEGNERGKQERGKGVGLHFKSGGQGSLHLVVSECTWEWEGLPLSEGRACVQRLFLISDLPHLGVLIWETPGTSVSLQGTQRWWASLTVFSKAAVHFQIKFLFIKMKSCAFPLWAGAVELLTITPLWFFCFSQARCHTQPTPHLVFSVCWSIISKKIHLDSYFLLILLPVIEFLLTTKRWPIVGSNEPLLTFYYV